MRPVRRPNALSRAASRSKSAVGESWWGDSGSGADVPQAARSGYGNVDFVVERPGGPKCGSERDGFIVGFTVGAGGAADALRDDCDGEEKGSWRTTDVACGCGGRAPV